MRHRLNRNFFRSNSQTQTAKETAQETADRAINRRSDSKCCSRLQPGHFGPRTVARQRLGACNRKHTEIKSARRTRKLTTAAVQL